MSMRWILLSISKGGFLLLAFSLLSTLWHLFLIGVLVLAWLFWIAVGVWIVVRLARTAHPHKEHKADGEE